MATVVFFSLPTNGHINPTLPLAAELVRRGERVFYYALEEFQPVIEGTGAIFRGYGPDFPLRSGDNERPRLLDARVLSGASQWVTDRLLPEVMELDPDYVIHGAACRWGNSLAQVLRLPSVCFIPGIVAHTLIVFGAPLASRARMHALFTSNAGVFYAEERTTALTRCAPDAEPVRESLQSLPMQSMAAACPLRVRTEVRGDCRRSEVSDADRASGPVWSARRWSSVFPLALHQGK